MSALGKTIVYSVRGVRASARGSAHAGRWVTRRVLRLRDRGAAGEVGMMRLLDLHAASCAGDTLITMGLAGTVFFNVSAGEARDRVALYLLLTMAPFALLAPIVGPILDRFRHGRRYALAATMLGRAFLAWLISDYLGNFGLYPAAFGVLVLSRAYGVARSAAVPRLLPEGLGLSEAGARASVFGTIAGAVVAPLGIAAFWFGPQWPLRVATVIFLFGMVVALRLPPRADSDPPETVPRVFALPGRNSIKVLSGRLVLSVLFGAVSLRALFGFLTLFLAFAVRSGHLPTTILGRHLHQTTTLGVVAGALGVGSFLAMAVGTRLKIRRPALLQAGALVLLTVVALLSVAHFSLATVALFCLAGAATSGLAKLALDATIQERVKESMRASAFAHSETAIMLAFVVGGAIGLIPFGGRLGLAIATGVVALAALRAMVLAGALRKERLSGSASAEEGTKAATEVIPAGRTLAGAAPTNYAAEAAEPRWTKLRSSKAAKRAEAERAKRAKKGDKGKATDKAAKAGEPDTALQDARNEGAPDETALLDSLSEKTAPAPRQPGDSSRGTSGEPRVTRTIERDDAPGYHLYQPSGEKLVHPDEPEDD